MIASGIQALWYVCVEEVISLHHKNAISAFIIEINSIAKWPLGSSVAYTVTTYSSPSTIIHVFNEVENFVFI